MRFAASILAVLALTFAAAAPTAAPAYACGGETQEQRNLNLAFSTVDASFRAIADGDAKAARKLWAHDARVVSKTAAGKSKSVAFKKALKKWIQRNDGMSWTIDAVTPTFDGYEVRATVTWNGTTYDDVLTLRRDAEGVMRIVDKTTTARAAVAEGSSYGA